MVFSDPPSIPNSTQDSGIQMVVATQVTVRMLPIFSGLSVAETEHLSKKITLVRASRGSNIVLETEPADSVYFIVAGFVKVVRGNVSDRYAIAVLSPGDIFGELGAITGSGRNASVIALTTCTLARLGKDEFLRCVDATPSVASFMVRYLARRIVEADNQIELFRGNIEPRIRFWLRQFRDRGLDAEVALTNAEIARLMGTSREVVSRIVNKLRGGERPDS